MPDGLITSRQLQNASTGIDLSVPQYQEIRGTMMTGHVEYQIVVVTRLAAFKSAKHKPGDVVQLVISKKYSEIDDFYCRLAAHYPKIALPAMPRKVLFVGDVDIRERRVAFDELLKFLSRNATLATCPELLEFLGAKNTDVADFKTKNVFDDKPEEEEGDGFDFFGKDEVSPAEETRRRRPAKPVKPHKPPDDEEEVEETLDPLGILKSKKPKPPAAEQPVKPKLFLFDEEVDSDGDLFEPAKKFGAARKISPAKDSDLKLFEDPDLGGAVRLGDSLLLPTAYTDRSASTDSPLDEDTEELFRMCL
ncbi:HCLS1-binding protein 3 isoform X2 [Amia ocellicauda]|uniref:HCLS1-binding protein 3 isoform X2 n=1 Tax=Amia ocellicauda TaxID=2972642 RepID=UPI0034641603